MDFKNTLKFENIARLVKTLKRTNYDHFLCTGIFVDFHFINLHTQNDLEIMICVF